MKLVSFVICEDIRREIGNKLFLMGLWDNEIFIEISPPDQIILANSIAVRCLCASAKR